MPGFETDSINVSGVTAKSDRSVAARFRSGPLLYPRKTSERAHVAVLGYDIANALFPDGNAVGRTFMMDGAEYTVIGVFAKAKGGFFGQNGMDNADGYSAARPPNSRYPQVDRYMIIAKAKPGMRKDAYDEVEAIMRRCAACPPTRRTISPSPRPTRSSSSSTRLPGSSAWWRSPSRRWACWWAASG